MSHDRDCNQAGVSPLSWGAASDQGKVRSDNQDAFLTDAAKGLFVVADGMGGQQAGALASKIVVSVLPGIILTRLNNLRVLQAKNIRIMLRDATLELSRRLQIESAKKVGLKGMGATLVMALLWKRWAYIAHMGDSRAYLFRKGQLTQLTEDHSVVSILLRHGDIKPEEAKSHPARGRLSRYIGMEAEVYPDVQTLGLKRGDRLLLCSDGLTDMVADETIATLLEENKEPQTTCQSLVDTANAGGGHDNITTVVMDW